MSTEPASRTEAAPDDAALRAEGLEKYYTVNQGMLSSLLGRDERHVHAVDGVSLSVDGTRTLGLVGESGCGKSTLGRTLVRLEEPTAGKIWFQGEEISGRSERDLRSYRSDIQFIHQDPSSSLNPRKRVKQILSRPLEIHTDLDEAGRDERVAELLDRVGLDPNQRHRYPHEFSGGQRQRIEIARALSVNPSVVVADEPTSALDVTVQAQILQLLEELQTEFDLSMVFISHDLRTVRYIADTVSVMYLGQLVETGATDEVFESPRHPYTQSLLSSAPSVSGAGGESITLEGEPPDPVDPPSGCRFHPRCPVAEAGCETHVPAEYAVSPSHTHRCHFEDADVFDADASSPTPVAPLGDGTEGA
ncbi:ABC transporter ATP-binding protein [Halorarum halobium]|uniref:ABC transporter ATP-binding protein n=1 Tax=Halorarum halobium TaxID=3075121 RepID=UPI0028ABEF44|nr:oligopeptide/dipeptide ABC transporter ATP-binding protein [Halobaculum sp. XH14]